MTSYSEEFMASRSHSQHPHHSSITPRTVESYTNSALTQPRLSQQFFEPLLLADGGDASLRHAQRHAADTVSTGYTSSADISYDLNNSNYLINQHHHQLSLNNPHATTSGQLVYGEVMPHSQPYDYDTDVGQTPTGYGNHPPFSLAAHLAHSDSIILSRGETFVYAVTPVRWWVLSVFCWLSFMQSFIWITYSPITTKAESYYQISKGQVDLLLNWGPIMNIPLLPFVASLASTSRGIQQLIYATAWLELLAVILHLIPEMNGADSSLHEYAIYFLHAAHILNAIAGPIMEATITKISALWFAPEERTTATALLCISNQVGSVAGFILGPAFVSDPTQMKYYLLCQFVMTFIGFIAVFPIFPRFYFPDRPEFFPSRAANEMEQAGKPSIDSQGNVIPPISLWNGLKDAWSNRDFVLVAVSSGLLVGIYSIWTSVLSTVLPSDSDNTCGWLSTAATLAGGAAGIIIGPIARQRQLRRRLKAMIIFCSVISVIFAAAFLLLTPSLFDSTALIPGSSTILMFVFISLSGAFVGATAPLSFELSVELTYPRWESISAGSITFINNVIALIFLGVAPLISGKAMTAFMFFVSILATLMLFPVRELYGRMDAEAAANHHQYDRRDSTEDGYRVSRRSSIDDLNGMDPNGHINDFVLHEQEDDLQAEYAHVMASVDAQLNSSVSPVIRH
jgi:FLVCR family MFS transporter